MGVPGHAAEAAVELTRGRLLARNTIWALAGQVAPLAVAVVTIPVLIRHLGVDRFGILTLTWMLIGYFSLFDLGIGRGLTMMAAEKFGRRNHEEIPALVWTSLAAMLALSVAGTLVLILVSPWLTTTVLRVPLHLQAETIRAFRVLALSLPAVVTTSGVRGVLEVEQRFGLLNAIRIPAGIFNFAGPLAVLPFSRSLVPIVAVLLLGRYAGLVAHVAAAVRCMPQLLHSVCIRRGTIGGVLTYGGWITVSSIISPLLMYLDRFVIGAMIGTSAVAFYATPWELVTKLFLIPGAVVTVLFPAFAISFSHDTKRAAFLLARGTKYILLVVFPIVLVLVTFAHDGLRLWLSTDFANHAAPVLRWLAVGVFLNCLSFTASALVQAAGRPQITAKMHIIELPLYAAMLVMMIRAGGIEAAAMAWTLRVGIDAAGLFFFSQRCVPVGDRFIARGAIVIVTCCAVFGLATVPATFTGRMVFVTVVLLGFVPLTWLRGLRPDERMLIRNF